MLSIKRIKQLPLSKIIPFTTTMLGVLLIFITIYPEKPRKLNLCLLLDDVRQAHWQAIHYGASKAAKKYNIALNSFDYQNEISAPVNDLKHHSCLKKHDAIIYGWQKETLLKSQATEQKMPIISLSDKNPNQTINQLIEDVAIKKYQLIQQWLANHANERTLNVYLMFGQKAHYPYQLLYQKLAAHLAANDKVRILGVSYEPDFYLNQYVAYSDAISNFDTIDIIIATNIAAQAVARINKNQPKAKQSKIVSLSNSPDILKLIALGEVEATIEQQAIKMGENLVIAALNQLQSDQEAYASIDVELITKENLAQASSNDSIVPYSYRVIYTVN